MVEVTYDPKVTNLSALTKALKRHRSFHALHSDAKQVRAKARRFLSKGELKSARGKRRWLLSKYTLRKQHPDLYYLPLTEKQAIKLNSWSYFGGPYPDLLTPTQKKLRPHLQSYLRKHSTGRLHPSRTPQGRRRYTNQLKRLLQLR